MRVTLSGLNLNAAFQTLEYKSNLHYNGQENINIKLASSFNCDGGNRHDRTNDHVVAAPRFTNASSVSIPITVQPVDTMPYLIVVTPRIRTNEDKNISFERFGIILNDADAESRCCQLQ